ncbi:methyltransferase FkbM [Ketogulonicigenium robustum]|uniref:Methyltransferase FkbM n=1 Tax=Ketogulonicigenium robustum TaxID=92947 RepID=A0A1W6NZ14_9RHOB|nr:FkbM family methyltransferase [Ketogulonicigenium robustum]ARO14393.1 methyltransferase FkbM [Ketogulonicigenium robustum]
MEGPLQTATPTGEGTAYFDFLAALRALAKGDPVRFPPFELARWGGLTFCLNYDHDPIQRALRNGRFYEAEALRHVTKLLPAGADILDVGSNIGNHALYFATQTNARRVVVIEPNPLAIAPLMANVVVNGLLGKVDLSYLGIGLSDHDEAGFTMDRHLRNLGATPMRKGDGQLVVRQGDALFADDLFHFVKIDTEGMEIKVLSGLSDLISRCRPLVMVEVQDSNIPQLTDWYTHHNYEPIEEWRVSRDASNYLLQPNG